MLLSAKLYPVPEPRQRYPHPAGRDGGRGVRSVADKTAVQIPPFESFLKIHKKLFSKKFLMRSLRQSLKVLKFSNFHLKFLSMGLDPAENKRDGQPLRIGAQPAYFC